MGITYHAPSLLFLQSKRIYQVNCYFTFLAFDDSFTVGCASRNYL